MKFSVGAPSQAFLRLSGFGLRILNTSDADVHVSLDCQALSDLGKELYSISNPPVTPIEYLKREADEIATRVPGARSPDGKVKVTVFEITDQRPDGSYGVKHVYESPNDQPQSTEPASPPAATNPVVSG